MVLHMEINDIHTKVKNVEGWLTCGEGEILYTLARNVAGKGAVVEIGSWQGKSTIYLGIAIKEKALQLRSMQ